VLLSHITLFDICGYSGVMQARSSLQDVLNCLSFFTIIFYIMAVAWLSSGGIVIPYAFPVLCMTSCFPIPGPMAQATQVTAGKA